MSNTERVTSRIEERELTSELMDFIEKCPSIFHTAKAIVEMLASAGFTELRESEAWDIQPGGKYFVKRNMSAIIAFKYPRHDFNSFSIVSPHGDSPAFKIKESPEMRVDAHYTKLNTEVYGGMTLSLWLDRPLSAAGRVLLKTPGGVKAELVDFKRDLFLIPSLAIHMNREANNGAKVNAQVDTLPLFGDETADFMAALAEECGVKKEDILSHELYLYNRERGTFFGEHEEFFASPKLDDLQNAFSAVKALIAAENTENVAMTAVFDNEEIGSMTKQGAASTFLLDTLERIGMLSGKTREERKIAVSKGFIVSADNGHAVHPLYPEKTDSTNRCYVNGGVVIKNSTAYATDAVSSAVFKRICENAGVPYQSYFNRSDVRGGSTLGNIANTHVAMNTVDIGLAQLSMHSPYETGGTADTAYMLRAMREFFSTVITESDNEISIKKAK